MKVLKLALLGVLMAGPAMANPVFLPVRDVAVNYELSTPGQAAQNYTVEYDAADELARVQNPAEQGMYFLVNLPQGQAQIVIPALNAIVQAPEVAGLTGMIYNADGATFTALGHGDYAGMGCQKYLIMNAQATGTACITPSGVVLHFSGHDANGSADATATSVTFGAQPSQDFTPPSTYSPITLPPGALAALLQPN
jgi:hypothetical protein